MRVEVSNCAAEELPELKRFIAENYKPAYILLDDAFFFWFLRDHPLNETRKITVKKITHEGKIVGMLGYQIHDMRANGTTVRGATFCNLMVAPAYRSLGLGPRLIQSLMDEFPLCLINGINLDSEYLYTSLDGWSVLGDLTRHVCILNPEKAKILLTSEELVSQFPPPISAPGTSGLRFERLTRCDEQTDFFWQRVRAQFPLCTERTGAYLNWRYADHPRFDYHITALRDGEKMVGLAVSRIETALGLRIERLVECLALPEYRRSLVGHIVSRAQRDGADLIDFFVSGQTFDEDFRACGFVNDRAVIDAVPMLFAPVDHSRKGIRCTAYHGVSLAIPDASFRDPDHWLITKGDGDQDRPT